MIVEAWAHHRIGLGSGRLATDSLDHRRTRSDEVTMPALECSAVSPRLGVGDLADRFGVAVSTLHYYERIGLLFCDRTAGNQRLYRADAVLRLSFIVAERNVGTAIETIRSVLECLPAGRPPNRREKDRFVRRWRSAVDERLAAFARCRDVPEVSET